MPECSGAPKESKPARLSSRLMTASWAKVPADPAILFRDRRAKQSRRAGLGPDLAVIHAALAPGLELRDILGRNEAPRLLFEQNEVLGHPTGQRKIENVHDYAVKWSL